MANNSFYTIQITDNDLAGNFLRVQVLPEGNIGKWSTTTFVVGSTSNYYECEIGSTIEDTITNLKTQLDNYYIGSGYPGPVYNTSVIDTDTLKVELIDELTRFDVFLFHGLEGNSILNVTNFINPQPDITPTVPYFKLPEANSISYALVQEHNNRDIYKNNFNSKSCQADNNVVDTMTQFFHWEDRPITQFRSNYATLSATLKDENDIETSLPVEMKVENLGIKQTMDCKIINIESEYPSYFGVYFESGQTYNYGTTTPLGTYELFGRLPEWGVVGNKFYSSLFNQWYDIVGVYYNSAIASDVLLIDGVYAGADSDDICSSLYNRFNYNIYEFVTPLFDKSNLYCQVNLSNTDTRDDFIEIKYSSEDLLVEEDIYGEKIELVWFDYKNTSDIFYTTGTYGINRLDYVSFTEGADSEKSTEKASKTVIPIASRNYHTKTLSLERVPAMLFRKLSEAFAHKEIFLNRIQYTVDNFDFEWVASTNSYTIEVDMFDAEDGFDPLIDRRYCGDRPIFPDLTGGLNEELDFEL